MPDVPDTLDYADPGHDQRVRRRRRLWLVALVLSALAVGVVGRMLYGRLKPAIAHRLEAKSAQRQVDELSQVGRPFAFAVDSAAYGEIVEETPSRADEAVSTAAAKFLARYVKSPPYTAFIAAARLNNAVGAPRVVCLRIDYAPTRSVTDTLLLLVAFVREPATSLGGVTNSPQPYPMRLARVRHAFRVNAPVVDATNPDRFLINGSADGAPFAFELALDVNDRPSLVELPAPTTQHAR